MKNQIKDTHKHTYIQRYRVHEEKYVITNGLLDNTGTKHGVNSILELMRNSNFNSGIGIAYLKKWNWN